MQPWVPEEPKKGMAIAGMVCGIVGCLIAWIPYICLFGWVLGVLGIVFGSIGIAQTSKNPDKEGMGMAVTGLVSGILSFFMPFITFFLLWAILIGMV